MEVSFDKVKKVRLDEVFSKQHAERGKLYFDSYGCIDETFNSKSNELVLKSGSKIYHMFRIIAV